MSDVYLSVVIPVYNAGKTIQRCVESVVREVETNKFSYEIILVNDGSTDNSLELCKEIASYNSNIKIFSQENLGPSVARNYGLQNAKGNYIALNDSDDEWLPGKLKYQIDYLNNNPDISLVCAQYGIHSKKKKNVEITYAKEVFHNYFSPQTSVFRKYVGEFRFPENQRYSEDMHFILDIMQKNRCVYLPFLATKNINDKFIFGENGLSSNLWEMERGELSNILFTLKIKKINFFVFCFAYFFSFLKFIRRYLITRYRERQVKME